MVQAIKRRLQATRWTITWIGLYAQVVAHQCQRQWQSTHRAYERSHLVGFILNHFRRQPRQESHTVIFAEFTDHGCPVIGKSAGYFRHASSDQVSAAGTTNFEGQSLFKLPGIINDQQHTARTNFSTKSSGPGSYTTQ